jgi:hypothetical protein
MKERRRRTNKKSVRYEMYDSVIRILFPEEQNFSVFQCGQTVSRATPVVGCYVSWERESESHKAHYLLLLMPRMRMCGAILRSHIPFHGPALN